MNPVEAVLSGMAARRRMQREDEDAEDRKQRRADEAEERTNRRTDRQFTMDERARTVKLRNDLGAAAAPVAVEQRDQAGPVDPASEVAAAAQPLAPVPTVQGRGFDSTDAASKAAAELNTPQAVAGRQAQVLNAAGDAAGAQQVRTGSMQEQSARFKLNADERADLDARFNADLQSRVNSWETFDAFTSESAGDGMGGKLKLQTTVSPDGATRIVNVVAPDGTLKPTGQTFPNTADGLMLATNELAKMSPEKKLAHLYQKELLRRQAAAQESTERYQAGMLKATQDKTAAGVELAQARAEAAMLRARGGGGGGAGGAAPQQSGGIDMGSADKFINTLFSRKDEMTGAATFDPKGADAVRGLVLRMPAAQVGDTQGAVNQALMAYNRYMALAGGNHDKAMKMMQQAMSPAAPATPAAPNKAPAQESAGPKAQPASQEQPGMLSRAAGAVSKFFSDGAETGRQLEAIRARVMAADNGGAPLTAAERQQARQFGIVPVR